MQTTEIDTEQLEKQKKLWKIFGRDTKAGKELFALYNVAEKPKIDYPKTKPRSTREIEQEKQRLNKDKKCPQKQVIDYPELPQPKRQTYYPVDFIPKRKNESVIRKEIQAYYQRRKKQLPANRGVDRANLVFKLQQKFKLQRGGLPKNAQMPAFDEKIELDEKAIKQQAKLKMGNKMMSYTNPLQEQKLPEHKQNLKEELEDLFEQIVAEIDERQAYLDSIQHLDEAQLKEKIKREMIERVGELQKITAMRK